MRKKIIFFLVSTACFAFFIFPLAASLSAGINYNYAVPGALKVSSFPDLVGVVANYIFNLAIPVAVLVIIYGGFRMLTSGGVPANYKKGLDALKYAALGLAILLIGKGFVSLVKSILSVK